MLCRFEDCLERAVADGLCIAHYRQRERGKPLTPVREDNRTPFEVLLDAAIACADAKAEASVASWERAKARLRWASDAHAARPGGPVERAAEVAARVSRGARRSFRG